MPQTSLLGLYNILFEFSISKQKCVKYLFWDKKSLEIKGVMQNAPKMKQFLCVNHKKFNKSNFLFHNYCISDKMGYND